jgi:UDP-N-acetylmuramoyl-tripeptide--D-alanyl-D-alanine ligase
MLELGPQGPEFHQQMGRLAARCNIQMLFTVGELAKEISQGALQDGFEPAKVIHCSDARQATQRLKKLLRPGDLVLLKGSRKVQLETILSAFSSQPQKD